MACLGPTPRADNGEMTWELMITEGNKQKRQSEVDPAFFLPNNSYLRHQIASRGRIFGGVGVEEGAGDVLVAP